MALPSRLLPDDIDTVIVGNGPSALILSFILSGHIPYYKTTTPHPDPILRRKLTDSSSLLGLDVQELTSHFSASRYSYSTQALPVNVLFDTLIRPLADTDPGESKSCVEWRYEPAKRVSHVALGNTPRPGGQWADDRIMSCSQIGTLSYAEMLSLPGYSLEEHLHKTNGTRPSEFYRPTRQEVTGYLAFYPEAVNIAHSIFNNVNVRSISRTPNGFYISSHGIRCKNLVLASGVFSNAIPPRQLLKPLAVAFPEKPKYELPVMIIGSGFTAADVILSSPQDQKILHIFKWDPERPSPLQACHPRAYPEYASVYRQMKLSAKKILGPEALHSPMRQKKSNPFFDRRDWNGAYEGLPNTVILDVALRGDHALITFEANDGQIFQREISNMKYVIGRRGSLKFLDQELMSEIFGPTIAQTSEVSNQTLRRKAESSFEVARNVFIVGSLAGDSLIRYAFGGCASVAHDIMAQAKNLSSPNRRTSQPIVANPRIDSSKASPTCYDSNFEYATMNGHANLGGQHEMLVDMEMTKCDLWRDAGWRTKRSRSPKTKISPARSPIPTTRVTPLHS